MSLPCRHRSVDRCELQSCRFHVDTAVDIDRGVSNKARASLTVGCGQRLSPGQSDPGIEQSVWKFINCTGPSAQLVLTRHIETVSEDDCLLLETTF
ncbi:hypothetical protein RRG08_054305 [Elysia crispata]|uniref:Uncharacterized protein n=1 Tax=Elysia crispata TaxID=231223 RepID=A0AAE0YR14_9GAST|nr:hypothetical protein RRG08_054305 [Elysia crispata]